MPKRVIWVPAMMIAAMAACGKKEPPPPEPNASGPSLTIELRGLVAPCCEKPVELAIGKIEGVENVVVQKKDKKLYEARVSLKPGRPSLSDSDIDEALAEATRAMGEKMRTRYEQVK